MKYTMKNITAALFVAIAMPSIASAECYADYKAKQTGGDLRLHYGVIALGDMVCANPSTASVRVQARIEGDGWTLLRIMSLFGADGLGNKQADAGEYFLRY